ncbi:DNA repair protein RadC [Alkalibaculum bacchi]|jgi:DNA repair protein RadC|uniref:DNA repair protein RadC n=1 Tax=Alkalibaculum bacchi TaxID=645887 RepID=A0A366I099_9FIRM|nr:DNA repair protein RadC [Alkalibaculum bacchi]RBP58440.1 DNA repair protein RadC [Alkalibaculum bacchi]
MANTDELRYIQAFSRIIGVKEDDAIEYAQRKGLNSLVDNATQLLSTPAQREKHQAFLDLYRMSSGINTRNPIINSPEAASDFFHSVMDKIYDKEAFVVAFLNTKNRVIDHEVVSVGTINSSLVHPREVFRNAIINKANSVILCHNHPSGDLTPSKEDINITERLRETGNLLGIRVLDHLIINGINQNELYSFKAKGVLEATEVYNITSSVRNEDANYDFTKGTKAQSMDFNVPIQEHTYPLPDPDISISDRNSYGYLDDGMLPLSRERAAELFEQDLTVYLLYEDDTESMAFDREDIDNHSGIFGIQRTDWIALQNYEAMKDKEKTSVWELEQRFLETPNNSFAIYQLKNGEELRDYRFEGLERLQNSGLSVDHDNYELIYTAPITDFNGNQNHTLNKLYEQFNINHPTDFRGHSISVSDIIALKVNGIVSSYYVDSFGFKEQSHFLPAHNYLETAEKSVEQNYNQLDGIINNKPTVTELEQSIKGERKEKKTSVVEKLKTKPFIEKDKQKRIPQIGTEKER